MTRTEIAQQYRERRQFYASVMAKKLAHDPFAFTRKVLSWFAQHNRPYRLAHLEHAFGYRHGRLSHLLQRLRHDELLVQDGTQRWRLTDFGRQVVTVLAEQTCPQPMITKQNGTRDQRKKYDWTRLEPQIEVLLTRGKNLGQIANLVGVNDKTLRSHLKRIDRRKQREVDIT